MNESVLKNSIKTPEIGENNASPMNPKTFWKPKLPRTWLTKTKDAPSKRMADPEPKTVWMK